MRTVKEAIEVILTARPAGGKEADSPTITATRWSAPYHFMARRA